MTNSNPTAADPKRGALQILKGTPPTELLGWAAVLVVFVGFYGETILALSTRWSEDPNYSHGFLVPIVSLYLAMQALAKPVTSPSQSGGHWLGGLLIGIGLALGLFTVLVPSLIVGSAGMLVAGSGLIVLLGGAHRWRQLRGAMFFLIFMVPLPAALYSMIAFPLQLFVSNVSAVGLQILGTPVLRDGNLIHLPGQTMHVAEACSGLRQLTAFIAICTCAALLMVRPMWYRIAVFVSSIPIAVVINVVRVMLTGLVLHYGDPSWTQGSLHTLEGLIMVAMGLGLLRLEVVVLDWLLISDQQSKHAVPVGKIASAPSG